METTTDWTEYTIKLAQLANERDKALNDKNYGKAIALHGQILDLNSELTIWLRMLTNDHYRRCGNSKRRV
jgi:hypothetical protein